MPENKITAELIKKYLDGDCTLEEKAAIIVWYNAFEKEDDILDQLDAVEKDRLKIMMLNRINMRIDRNERMNIRHFNVKRLIYISSGIAAAMLIFLGIVFYQKKDTTSIKQFSNNIKEEKVLLVENQGSTLYQRKLEDGTVIWLSPGAKIKLPEHFSADKREVSMEGKVFFEVAKNPERPFLIYAGGLTTKVLGTSFLINAEEGKDTEVSVVTGKVAVNISDSSEEEILLLPEQKAIFSVAAKSLEKAVVPEKSEVKKWKKAKLSFDNITIKEVVDVLEANFNVTINTNKSMESCVLKADFSDQNLAAILEMMCKSIDATYEISGDTVTIAGRGCN